MKLFRLFAALVAAVSLAAKVGAQTTTLRADRVVTPTVEAPSNLTLHPTEDLITSPAGNDIYPGTSGVVNLGTLTNRYSTLRVNELLVETLVSQNTIATIGGRILVLPTTLLTADLASGGTTLTAKHNNISNGDRIYLEADGKVEWMAVTSSAGGSAGAYTYTVTRNLDGTGANDWYVGDAVADTRGVGNGFIDLFSVSGVNAGSGPSIVGNVRVGTTYDQIEPRWVIGNLDGLYGYTGYSYGAAFGKPSGSWVKIDDTNGLRLGFNATTNVQIDGSGNASFSGGITSSTGTIGGFTIGADYLRDAGNGMGLASTVTGGDDIRVWIGCAFADRATCPFRIHESGGLIATGVNVTGNIVASSGDISGALVANSITSAMIVANTIVAADIAANTITASQIAAGTITATEIAANTITAAKIAAGTITATEIAANTITAGKLNVSTLGAIAADLGTVTAGGGAVVLDSNGFTLNSGTGTPDKLKWSNGAAIQQSSSTFVFQGAGGSTPTMVTGFDNPYSVTISPGGLSVAATSTFSGNVLVQTGATIRSVDFGAGGAQFVCVDNSGVFYVSPTVCN